MAPIERNDPPGLSPPPGGRYAHVVSSGNLVWVAGQTARDASGTVVGPNDPLVQARQVYANLLTAIEAVGGTFSNYVKLTIFLTSEEHLDAARTAQNECWGDHSLPASSMVVVKALANPEYLIEIEGFAVLDS